MLSILHIVLKSTCIRYTLTLRQGKKKGKQRSKTPIHAAKYKNTISSSALAWETELVCRCFHWTKTSACVALCWLAGPFIYALTMCLSMKPKLPWFHTKVDQNLNLMWHFESWATNQWWSEHLQILKFVLGARSSSFPHLSVHTLRQIIMDVGEILLLRMHIMHKWWWKKTKETEWLTSVVKVLLRVYSSSRCSVHPLEANSILPGGLSDSAKRRRDRWHYSHEAQWEKCCKYFMVYCGTTGMDIVFEKTINKQGFTQLCIHAAGKKCGIPCPQQALFSSAELQRLQQTTDSVVDLVGVLSSPPVGRRSGVWFPFLSHTNTLIM